MTGADRGVGRAFVVSFLAQGAYATARRLADLDVLVALAPAV